MTTTRQDLIAVGAVGAVIAACLLTPNFMDHFIELSRAYPYLSSFLKFAVLSTFGEMIGLRITQGVYNRPGFGLLARAVVWGFLGIGIKAALTVYANGTPFLIADMGLIDQPSPPTALPVFWQKVVCAVSISIMMNATFGPVFMTLHRITDTHILANGGSFIRAFTTPLPVGKILHETNWKSLWGFVFKKTLPLFWVPAHTITFLLPGHFQVVFAALLGVVLGIFLAVASLRKSV